MGTYYKDGRISVLGKGHPWLCLDVIKWFNMIFLAGVNSRSVVQQTPLKTVLFQVVGCLDRIKEDRVKKWFQKSNKVVSIWGVSDEII